MSRQNLPFKLLPLLLFVMIPGSGFGYSVLPSGDHRFSLGGFDPASDSQALSGCLRGRAA